MLKALAISQLKNYFNRTIEELKFSIVAALESLTKYFNRTIEELKLQNL